MSVCIWRQSCSASHWSKVTSQHQKILVRLEKQGWVVYFYQCRSWPRKTFVLLLLRIMAFTILVSESKMWHTHKEGCFIKLTDSVRKECFQSRYLVVSKVNVSRVFNEWVKLCFLKPSRNHLLSVWWKKVQLQFCLQALLLCWLQFPTLWWDLVEACTMLFQHFLCLKTWLRLQGMPVSLFEKERDCCL